MEPVTHVLTGICLARTGFNRKTAYAVAAMAVAAEFPDIDMLWSLRGPVESFQHHRGITHTFVGLPFEAALIVGGVWAWDRWRGRGGPLTPQKRGREWATRAYAVGEADSRGNDSKKSNGNGKRRFPSGMTKENGFPSGMTNSMGAVPVRWGWLYGAVLVALLSHLLLDFTNNYGIRPFFPFDTHWYAWSIVFIFDPLLFGLLGAALIAPLLFGLIGAELGARRQRFRGRGWAVAGLLGVVAWWGLRAVEHGRAVDLAQQQTVVAPVEMQIPFPPQRASALAGDPGYGNDKQGQVDSEPGVAPAEGLPVYLQARRTLASPDPLSPFRWSAVTDFGQVYRQSEIDAWHGTLEPDAVLTPKPGHDAALRAAAASALGRAYVDWSPMPYLEEQRVPGGGAVVTLSDPRFMGGWMAAHGRPAPIGTVRVDAQGQVLEQSLDQRVER